MDDLEDNPEWHRKVQDELGDQISIAYKRIHEKVRQQLSIKDMHFMRLENDKQIFFK